MATLSLLLLPLHLLHLVPSTTALAKSQPWDWQKGTGEYARFAVYEEELRAMAKQPYFSKVTTNISVVLGETAYLPCRAKDLANSYMVTWMRVADVTVLSVGALTFSSDQRFSVIHVPRPRIRADDWTLVISKSQLKDTGRYECSVNTLPKISHAVDLTVRERPMQDSPKPSSPPSLPFTPLQMKSLASEMSPHPTATISGPKVQYVSAGSTVGLECRIVGLTSPPLSLYWRRGERVLTAKERPGISLESEKVPGVSTARLYLSHTTVEDSHTYSCLSDIAEPASVQLIVTQDHLSSALMGLSSAPSLPSLLLPLLLFPILPLFL